MPGLIDPNELEAALDQLHQEPTTMEQVREARVTRECHNCGNETTDTQEVFGEPRCEECRDRLTCNGCQQQVSHEDDLNYVEDEGDYCYDCSFYCDAHEGYDTGASYETTNERNICESCADEYFYRCNHCDLYEHADNIIRYIQEPGEDYDNAEYACESCADGMELRYNTFLELYTPCPEGEDGVVDLVVGINMPMLRAMADAGSINVEEAGMLPRDIFMKSKVNLRFMNAAMVMTTEMCLTGHLTTENDFQTGRDGYCTHCVSVMQQVRSYRAEREQAEMPEYTIIGGYHTHQYTDRDHLIMAKDRKTNNRMLFGIELETSFSSSHISNLPGDKRAQRVLKELRGTFVGERDGTVSNGAELISKPMSYDFLTSKTMLKRLNAAVETMKDLGAVNGTHNGIGLHIHVSRAAFKSEKKATVEMEDDMNWFINCFKDYVEVISRRKETSYCKFPISSVSKPMNASRMYIDKKALQKGSHGYALNLQSNRTPTYEFRVFNSTQDIEQLIASVEFVRNLAFYVINEPTIIGATFKDVVMYRPSLYLEGYVKKLVKNYPDRMKGWDRVKLKKEIEVK